MNSESLSKLERVELREVWKTEASDFTPWLAEEKNLALLGEAIGIGLELEATEKNVGPFRADILCKDTLTKHWVLIENQLERSDHRHLGQLLTYAAGLKAATIVWIVANFADEHRAALDWLNDITDERFNFFALEVQLLRIDASLPAPHFSISCKPNDWSRTVSNDVNKGGISDTKLLQQEYWAALRVVLQERHSFLKPQTPQPQNYTNFALGRSQFTMNASVNAQKNSIEAAIVFQGKNARANFSQIQSERETIEREVGTELRWDETCGGLESKIRLRSKGVDWTERGDWPQQHKWLAEALEKLHRVFSPRVKRLQLPVGEEQV